VDGPVSANKQSGDVTGEAVPLPETRIVQRKQELVQKLTEAGHANATLLVDQIDFGRSRKRREKGKGLIWDMRHQIFCESKRPMRSIPDVIDAFSGLLGMQTTFCPCMFTADCHHPALTWQWL